MHGIETNSARTWTASERDEEPRGRARNWLRDEDMLPRILPQARILFYEYNSNCYSDNAQEIDILGLGESFLAMLEAAKDNGIGKRSLLFIGSCFGGIVVAQVCPPAFTTLGSYMLLMSLLTMILLAGTSHSQSTTRLSHKPSEINHRCCVSRYPLARNGNS